MRIILIEDDLGLAGRLARALGDDGHEATVFHSRWDGLRASATERGFDLVVVDLVPSDIKAVEFVWAMRQAGGDIPLLMLSTNSTVEHRVEALHAGADDYLVKPFALAEFLARVQSVGRRVKRPTRLEYEGVILDTVLRTAAIGGSPLALTPTEFDLLEYLIRNRGRVVRRSRLKTQIWKFDLDTHTRVVDVYVHYLRSKLARAGAPHLIETVRNVGYCIGR